MSGKSPSELTVDCSNRWWCSLGNQQSSHLPDYDEQHFHRYDLVRRSSCLSGWHLDFHKRPRWTPADHSSSTWKASGTPAVPLTRNQQEVQAFLGFTNFYCQFIQDFSHHARPLFDLTRKDQKWQWKSSEASTFQKLKEVTSTPVLTTPVDDQPFRIEADSSDFATGAVLSQLSAEDGKWHPVAFL